MNTIIIKFPDGWTFQKAHSYMTNAFPNVYWSWFDGTLQWTFYIPLETEA